MLDISVITASATPVSTTDTEPLVPTKLLANVLTDDQRALAVKEDGVGQVAAEIVTLLRRPSHKDTDLARIVAHVGGTRMRQSAIRESLRALVLV